MIPVKLKLSNFTSYGESPPELDFTEFHLAAISGVNGAGKSSLLDAITWCVWGTSRAGDSSDSLIKLGQNGMFVEFSFKLDSHLYTIKRQRSKKSGGHSSLEFWSNAHNLTEGTIKTTQQKIIDTLHLSYETFTNSSFIRQGHADEFTTKGPTDRKKILADILGLDHYDRLEEKAKEKSKESQTKLALLEYQILEIETELSFKKEREQALSQIRLEGEQTQADLKKTEDLIKSIEDQKQLLNSKIQILEEQKSRFQVLNQELTDLKLQIEAKKTAQEQFQAILSKKSSIEKNYQQIQKLEQEKYLLDEKRSNLIQLKDELANIQKRVLIRENKRADSINKVGFNIKQLETENSQHNLQVTALKNKKDICPTCGQIINSEKNKQLLKNFLNKIAENEIQISELNKTLKKYREFILPETKLVQEKEEQIKNLEENTKSYLKIIAQISQLTEYTDLYLKLTQAEVAVKTQAGAILDLQKIYSDKKLGLGKIEDFEKDLAELINQLEDLENQLTIKAQIKQDQSEKLLDLRSRFGEAKSLVSRSKQMADLFKDKQAEKTNLTKEKEIYETLTEAFGKKGIQAMIIEQAIPEIEDEANNLLSKLTEGRMQVRLDTQKETKTKIARIDGKKDYATVETLDIIISDEMGERSYEMYSGGETFRVNIAIRLAISKLLTHRAGAKLQFLVIDEGFGTQDTPGRARLVEVLDSIKNDFEKILVITHLEELKEEFPTRIEVSKSPAGSTFEVINN